MSFLDIALRRQSVRTYEEKPVEREKLDRCIEAARIAPSANNCQPWHFIVVDEPGLVKKVAEATFSPVVSFNKFTVKAAVMIVALAERPNLITQIGGAMKNLPFYLLDLGMAVENFCLQAAEEGIGTCMLGWFNERKIKKLLDIPNRKKIGLVISAGYPREDKLREKKRKPKEHMSSYNRYGEKE